jgi:nucleoside-diphosphate-sugar epimerase
VIRREDDPCRPLSPYAAAKLAGEHYCRCYSELFGLDTVRLRFFNVFGPRQDPHSAYAGVVARFIAAAWLGQAATIHGDGAQSRDFTFVADAVQAVLLAVEAPAAPGKVYNVGNGARTSVRELWRQISELAGRDVSPVQDEARPGDVRHSQADIALARLDLGYRPRVSLHEGLKRTLDHHAGSLVAAQPDRSARPE